MTRTSSLLLILLLGAATQADHCPAKDNTLTPWGTGETLFSTGNCIDKSSSCSSCLDLCSHPDYTHWITENCARSCGQCQEPALQSHLESAAAPQWSYYKGYPDSSVISRHPLTTLKECGERCLAERRCVGAFVTEYTKLSRMECVLAGSGQMVERRLMFGATRETLRSGKTGCGDHSTYNCERFSKYCSSTCPYLKKLTNVVCPSTCQICQHNNNNNDNNDSDGGMTQWETMRGRRILGTVGERNLRVEDAKKKCCEMGGRCKGVTCKYSKCNVLTSQRKLKRDPEYTSYAKM